MRDRSFAIRFAACLLAGCLLCPAPRAAALWDAPFAFPGGPGTGLAPARSETQQAYGSAGLLAWPSILVSVYLDEQDGAAWTQPDIERSRRQLALALGWIRQQCEAYSACPAIHYDTGAADSGLFVRETYRGHFTGNESEEGDDSFYDAMDALCARYDTQALHERYGTASVGFLLFFPVAGNAFTMVHYYDDGNEYYHEYSCLYRYDAWSGPDAWPEPALYAHEILHLYGAPDLYEGSADPYVTPELLACLQENWPDALMADTYSADGRPHYDAVTKTLCPLTACRLGLCSTWPGQEQFPDTVLAPAGVFTLGNTAVPGDTGALAI